jgi:hypothetical protein
MCLNSLAVRFQSFAATTSANMNLPEVLGLANINFKGAGEPGLAGNHTGKKYTADICPDESF